MQTRTSGKGITFAVHKVEPATEPLHTMKTYRAIMTLIASCEETNPRPLQSCSGYNSECVSVSYNPLLGAVHLAFSEHRPLVLSPDMIWIAVVQGLALHIKNNAEKLRDRIVSHKGKKVLEIVRADLTPASPENDWASVVEDLSQLLHGQLGEKYEKLMTDFSTTGDIERTVCQIALLDAFQPYFAYYVACICGIPEITLEGETSDWIRLREKIEALSYYDLDWWLVHLRPIADQFVRASKGDIDLQHWQNIYKLQKAYGWERINGWMARLIPYLKNHGTGNYSVRNPMLAPGYREKVYANEQEMQKDFFSAENAVTTRDVPSGLSQAPFILTSNQNGRSVKQSMHLLGGFVGVDQDPDTLALRPRFGWAVRVGSDTEQLLANLRDCCDVSGPLDTAEYDEELRRLVNSADPWDAYLPDDFLSFYRQCDGLTVKSSDPVWSGARIRGLKELASADRPKCEELPPSRAEVLAAAGAEQLGMFGQSDDQSDGGWGAPDVPPSPMKEKISWVRLCDLPDGSRIVYQLNGADGNWFACMVPSDGSDARVIAQSFTELLRVVLAAAQ